MPLLKDGQLVADLFQRLEDTTPLPAANAVAGGVIVSLTRFQAERAVFLARAANPATPVGVVLAADEEASALAQDLSTLALVGVSFPKFRDGRAFTTTRILREKLGYTGEIRAFGHIVPDQYLFLQRLGITTVEIPQKDDPEHWARALREFSIVYQPAQTPSAPIWALQRRI
jgi:uncharacterized protein (DUF934 family)